MNKSLNVFLSVLLCVVLCVGVLTSLYTTDDSSVSQPQYGYSSSTSTGVGAPAISFGTGASGDGLAVPMSSSRSRGGVRSSSPHRPVASSPNRLITSSPNSLITSSPNSLITYMSSSQKATSFGGGSNTAGVSMSGGVVSANSQSPIANNQLSLHGVGTYLSSSSSISLPLRDGQGAGYNSLLPYSPEDIPSSSNGMRAIGGRHNAPGTLGGDDSNYINWLESNGWLYGEGCLTLTEQEVRDLYAALTGDFSFQNIDQWNAFWEWFMGKQSDDSFKWKLPLSDAIPFVLLLALAYALYIFVNRKQIQTK